MPKGLGVTVAPMSAGMLPDLESLLKAFSSEEDFHYDAFRKVFVHMKFSTIFRGTASAAEARDFNEKLLSHALYFALPTEKLQSASDLTRPTFGVYVLYALFSLQPTKTALKIRITPSQAYALIELKKALVTNAACHDAVRVLALLVSKQAFEMCAFPDEHNPLNFRRYSSSANSDIDDATAFPDAGLIATSMLFGAVHDIEKGKVVKQLSALVEKYAEMKRYIENPESPHISMVPPVFPATQIFRSAIDEVTKQETAIELKKEMCEEKQRKRNNALDSTFAQRRKIRQEAMSGSVHLNRKYAPSVMYGQNVAGNSQQKFGSEIKRRLLKKKKHDKGRAVKDESEDMDESELDRIFEGLIQHRSSPVKAVSDPNMLEEELSDLSFL